MSETVVDSVTARASELELARAKTREEIDDVLESLPENRLEARRQVTRQLGFDPTAEELQTIEKLAHEISAQGEVRSVARSALALRLLCDKQLRELFDGKDLSAAGMSRAAEMAPGVLRVAEELEAELQSRLDEVDKDERELLLQVAQCLMPEKEPLVAGAILAPRLALLAQAGDSAERLQAAVPALDAEGARMFRAALDPGDDPASCPSRNAINALALRTVIREDLQTLESLRGVRDSEANQRREALRERLLREKIAYQVVSERLQKEQDTALVAGLQGFAETLRQSKQDLFSTYLELASTLNNSDSRSAARTASLNRVLDECSAVEARIAAEREEELDTDELFLNALRDAGSPPEGQPMPVGAREQRRERLRLGIMSGLAIVAIVACLGFWMVQLGGSSGPSFEVPIQELESELVVNRALSIGPMMYAQVNSWQWTALDGTERIEHVDELGRSAADRGFKKLYLTDENQLHLASWSATDGTKLVESEAP